MNVRSINDALLGSPGARLEELLPHLARLREQRYVFGWDFGLGDLPLEPGLLAIRGPRQYGKSTWLEARILATHERFGPGSVFYLNGDDVRDADALAEAVRSLVPLFRPDAPVRRLFIDEVTAVKGWERALKSLLDGGDLRRVLVVTTGSQASDLRRGVERLPGRKGRLARTSYLFTPVSFREFRRVCGGRLGERTLSAYLLSGGAPVACAEIAHAGRLPEWIAEMIRDWVLGECAASGRSRSSLVAVMEQLARLGGTPVGQAKLAREAGLANNTVAVGYLELLADLMVVGSAHAWDPSRRIRLRRKPAKLPFVNLLAALAWDPSHTRSMSDLEALPEPRQGVLLEWLVAQEIWRRAARRGDESPEELVYWSAAGHEIDYVVAPDELLEVKRGAARPIEYAWFPQVFPKARLTVLTSTPFATDRVRGITVEEFLDQEP